METQLLDDDLGEETSFIRADKGKRFLNYFIDILSFYVLIMLIAFVFIDFFEESGLFGFFDDTNWLMERVFGAILIVIYYSILESITGGKSFGKYITRTRVLNIDGSNPEVPSYILRSLSRVVPFEPFSFFGNASEGWHDKWTDTMVIDESKSSY